MEARSGDSCPTQLLELGSDLALRSHWSMPESFRHPAKLHLGLLQWLLTRYTQPGETIADLMAGSGSILIAREIEPEWNALMQENATRITVQAGFFAGQMDSGQADAREPWGYTADHILFSPPYGCAASPTPNARRVLPYRLHHLALPYDQRWPRLALHPTSGAMGAVVFHYGRHPAQIGHWRGKRYWKAMRLIYTQAHAALRGPGSLILVVKDHIYQGQRVHTAN